uniref:MADS-box domain-containing protein n=1 Tax=Setaria italica TaxID=4555 RepID=K3ZMX1_SETIT
MATIIPRMDGHANRAGNLDDRTNTLFSIAKDLSKEFGAHVAIVMFSPTNEPKAYCAPTAKSVLRTYLPKIHSSLSPACSEMAEEATTRVDGMKQEAKETAFLAEAERACQATSWLKIFAASTTLGVDELPVFIRALEVLRTDVQGHLDAMESSQKEKMHP